MTRTSAWFRPSGPTPDLLGAIQAAVELTTVLSSVAATRATRCGFGPGGAYSASCDLCHRSSPHDGPHFRLGCEQPRRTPSGCVPVTNHSRCPRKPVKTRTDQDRVRLFFSGKKPRENFLDQKSDRGFLSMETSYNKRVGKSTLTGNWTTQLVSTKITSVKPVMATPVT